MISNWFIIGAGVMGLVSLISLFIVKDLEIGAAGIWLSFILGFALCLVIWGVSWIFESGVLI